MHKIIYKRIMDLISNDWKHLLRTKYSQKSLLKTFCYNNRDTRQKYLQKTLIKKITSSFNLIILNTTNLSNSFQEQTSWKDTLFSFLKSVIKLLMIGLRNALMDIIYFLTPQNKEWKTYQIIWVQDIQKYICL